MKPTSPRSRRAVAVLIAAALIVACGLAVTPALAKKKAKKTYVDEIQAVAYGMAGAAVGQTTRVKVGVMRWTTDEERETLLRTLIEKGNTSMWDTLQKMDEIGYIRFDRSMLILKYAREFPTEDGGRRIVLATDRPLTAAEQFRASPSLDYNVLLTVVEVGADGTGEGSLFPAVEVTFDRETKQLELTNRATQPMSLKQVRAGIKK